MPKSKPKRVLIEVDGGIAYFNADPGIDVEIIDWDSLRDGTLGTPWTNAQVQALRDTFRGLLEGRTVERLMKYVEVANAND